MEAAAWERDLAERSARIRAKSASLVAAATTSAAEWRAKYQRLSDAVDVAADDARVLSFKLEQAGNRAAAAERRAAAAESERAALRAENQQLQAQVERCTEALATARSQWEKLQRHTAATAEEGEPPDGLTEGGASSQALKRAVQAAVEDARAVFSRDLAAARAKHAEEVSQLADQLRSVEAAHRTAMARGVDYASTSVQPSASSSDNSPAERSARSVGGAVAVSAASKAPAKGGMLRRLSVSLGGSEIIVAPAVQQAEAVETAERTIKDIVVTRTMLAKKFQTMSISSTTKQPSASEQQELQELQKQLAELESDFRDALQQVPDDKRSELSDKLVARVAQAERDAEEENARERQHAAERVARLMGIIEDDENEKEQAATVIQAAFRGSVVRNIILPEMTESYDLDTYSPVHGACLNFSDEGTKGSTDLDAVTTVQRRCIFLSGISPFNWMSEHELEDFAASIVEEEYEDEPIAEQGDTTSVYIVQEGCCVSSVEQQDGDLGRKRVYRVGEMIGIGGCTKTTVVADGPVSCLRLPHEAFARLIEEHLEVKKLFADWETSCAAKKIQALVRGRSVRERGVIVQQAVHHFGARYALDSMTIEETVCAFRSLGLGSYVGAVRNSALNGNALKLAFERQSSDGRTQSDTLFKTLGMDNQAQCANLTGWVLGMIEESTSQQTLPSSIQNLTAHESKSPSMLRRLSLATRRVDSGEIEHRARSQISKVVAANAAVAEHVERMTKDSEVVPDAGAQLQLQLQHLQRHLSEQEAAFRCELDKLPTEVNSQRRTLEDELAIAIAKAERDAKAARVRERQSATDAAARLMDRYFHESSDEYQNESRQLAPTPSTHTETAAEADPEPDPEGSDFVFQAVFSKQADLGLTWASMSVDGHDDSPVIQHVEAGSAAEDYGCKRGMVLGAVSGVAIGVIGGYSDIMQVISTTRPITLQMIAVIDVDKATRQSTGGEFNGSYALPRASPASPASKMATGQPGRLRRMSLSLGANKSVSENEALARESMGLLVSASKAATEELAAVIAMEAPKNSQEAGLHRMGVELKTQEIQQRVASAEKAFRQRCYVLPDETRLALEEELRTKLRS